MNFLPNTHLGHSTATTYNNKINKWLSLMPSDKNTITYIFLHPYFSVATLRKYLVENDIDTAPTLNSYIKSILSGVQHNSELFTHINDK